MQLSLSLAYSVACLFQALPASAQNISWPWQTYKSSSREPPSLNITKYGPTSPGYLFFVQNGNYAHNYSLFIMSDDNELVWQSAPLGDYAAFKAQTFEGKPVLTFFNGISLPEPYGWGHGIIQILDESYTSIYNVSLTAAEENFVTIPELDPTQLVSYLDLHESKITADDTILVTVYNVTQYDLSSVGGPVDGWVSDSIFYELDIKTNEILFKWSALSHVDQIPISDVLEFYPLADYGKNQSLPYGYFHINSVEKFTDGSYLISSRYYSSVFKIAKDGSVEWTLQGKSGGDFELGEGLSFSYQHDARIHREVGDTVQISIFDNANSDVVSGIDQTKGIFMNLNTKTMKATLDRAYIDPRDTVYAHSQGNLQKLDDGHVVMGYGSTPKIREYSSDGSVAMQAQFGPGDGYIFSYRAYRLPWVGKPKTAPDAFACIDAANNKTMVYMSWLGATEHRAWKVFTGASNSSLTLAAQVEKTGFETVTSVPGQSPLVRVEAQGRGIGTFGASPVILSQDTC
ncbi:ASST-domain-containing protein [Annulohypoxylon maeteangense]|uniref:ASST-domain-containing protein n=1 Tax=Annulohypoxylon maeteangense TaxID=1927788 RepID=UPI0020071F84|nr:ASST-domain-containing protein [Annulohypoxylon maeteangense]KAI0882630.1 ASST-domain-containing protein [Annulohypoxylon maeteangense]